MHRKEALWSQIPEELNLTVIDVKRWFVSQRTRYDKLSKQQSGQASRELTQRQSWAYEQMGFLKSHIRRKGGNRSAEFEASATRQHDGSRGSNTDMDSLEGSVLGSQMTLPLQSSTSVSTDSRTLEHFEQMRTLISGFLQQMSTSEKQPFFTLLPQKLTRCLQKNIKISMFKFSMLSRMSRQQQGDTSCQRCQLLLQLSHRRLGYCHQQHSGLPASRQLQAAIAAKVSTTHQFLLVLATLHQSTCK